MARAKKAEKEKDRGLPVGPISERIAELGVQRGLGKLGEEGLSTAIRQAVSKHAGKEIGSANWTNYWRNKKKWPISPQRGTIPVLLMVANYFAVPVEYLRGLRTPVPIVGEISTEEGFSYRETWLPEEIIGEASNWKWEDDQIKQIYAIRIKDWSFAPAFNKGDLLYVQKNPDPQAIKDFDRVVYPDSRGRAQLYRITLKPETITLISYNPTVPPESLPRKHLKNCDLVIEILAHAY